MDDADTRTAALPEEPPIVSGSGPPPDLVAPADGRGRWWHRLPRWSWIVATALAIVLVAGSLLLTFVSLPYYTISPGDALDVSARITVEGEPVSTEGEVLLLFVRQRARINGWQFIQATFDDDIDLLKEERVTGGLDPSEVRTLAQADMEQSQASAKKVALETLGFDVPFADDGLAVLAVFDGRPAAGILERGDELVSVDGIEIETIDDLSEVLDDISPRDEVEITLRRDGGTETVTVGTYRGDDGQALMGIYVGRRYDFPIDIEIDTNTIGGPSAGLAMTLSVIDALSPADLTGGLSVAATGEIDPEGNVGSVGGIGQKTVSARANDADLLLVPVDEVDEAQARANELEVVGVSDIDDALAALEAAGGEPLVVPDPEELLAAA